MDAIEALITRRSVRHFTTGAVSPQALETMLRAAMQAPSAGNEQPWHFVVLQDRALLEKITTFHPYADMLHHAPLAVLVCGDERLEKYPGHWVQDCSAAAENLMLAAHAQGLGSVWLGVEPDAERVWGMRQLLRLPLEVHPLALIAIGHPAEEPRKVDRFNPQRIHYDRWE